MWRGYKKWLAPSARAEKAQCAGECHAFRLVSRFCCKVSVAHFKPQGCPPATCRRSEAMLTSISLCRKKKAVHKVSTTDDKRLQATLKRLGVNTIPGIEEVNLFVDNDVIHFTNPKGMSALYPRPESK